MMKMMMMMLTMVIEIRIMKKVEILSVIILMIWRMEIEKFLKTQILLEN